MIVRIQSPMGMKRFEVDDTDRVSKLTELAVDAFELGSTSDCYLSKSGKVNDLLQQKPRTMLKSLNIKHGDILYLLKIDTSKEKTLMCEGGSSGEKPFDQMTSELRDTNYSDDALDSILEKMDGRIKRPKSQQFCHHPDSGQCIHCVPLEPYDVDYLSHCDPPVKFMSFHAYLRKLMGGQGHGKFVRLENLDCSLRPGCLEHPPWPEGICTKCQPKPVTLEIQPYRHVDFIQFENPQIVETFLDYWRMTGKQRIGLLLGHYAPFDTVGAPPLAIKAVVSVIYEPQQVATARSVKFACALEELMPPHVKAVANRLGLSSVGWIFTDLTAEDAVNGTVKHYRGTMDTFFMSAEECITAARLQILHPNASRFSPDGQFGSKFVTVVVTGGPKQQIHFEGYQGSNVAMALERAKILYPTYDAPELGFIRETTKEKFVPDVFYTSKDKYGNTVTNIARPLPIEYLLLDMPAAFPIEPSYTFVDMSYPQVDADSRFPVENRADLGQLQTFPVFAVFFRDCRGLEDLRSVLLNFHVLAWLAGDSNLPLASNPNASAGLEGLLTAVKRDLSQPHKDAAEALQQWASSSPLWATTLTMIQAFNCESIASEPSSASNVTFHSAHQSALDGSGVSTTSSPPTQGTDEDQFWACKHCTFHNNLGNSECEICSLPREF